jgi:hypothetical protein
MWTVSPWRRKRSKDFNSFLMKNHPGKPGWFFLIALFLQYTTFAMHLIEDLHKKSEEELIDLLSNYTSKYTQMVLARDLSSQEFYDCKMIVRYLQGEIEARRNAGKMAESE